MEIKCDQQNCNHNHKGLCTLESDWLEEFKIEQQEDPELTLEEFIPGELNEQSCLFPDIDESLCPECGGEIRETYDTEEYWGAKVRRYYTACVKCG